MSGDPDSPGFLSDSIDREASDWVSRQDRGLSTEEEIELSQWLDTDPRHAERFEAHGRTWRQIGALDRRLLVESALAATRSNPFKSWLRYSVAAASLALVGAFAYLGMQSRSKQQISQAFLSQSEAALSYERHYLIDGSLVELNRGARARAVYTETERRIDLLVGEAHFSVEKDARRPFVVYAGGATVRAVGTAFNVQIGSESVEVIVAEGIVRFEFPKPRSPSVPDRETAVSENELAAGQRAELSLRLAIRPSMSKRFQLWSLTVGSIGDPRCTILSACRFLRSFGNSTSATTCSLWSKIRGSPICQLPPPCSSTPRRSLLVSLRPRWASGFDVTRRGGCTFRRIDWICWDRRRLACANAESLKLRAGRLRPRSGAAIEILPCSNLFQISFSVIL